MLSINGFNSQDYESYIAAHQNEVQSQTVFESKTIPGINPLFWEGSIPQGAREFFFLNDHHVSALRNDTFHNATVAGTGVIFTSDKNVLHGQVPVGGGAEQFLTPWSELELGPELAHNSFHCSKLENVTDTSSAIVIARSATGNYHHVLCDVAPRLRLVQAGLTSEDCPPDLATAPILISPRTPDWAMAMLVQSSGLPEQRFLRLPKQGALRVGRLIVPSVLNNFAHWVSPETQTYYQGMYRWAKKHSTASYGSKIYTIRREMTQDRRRPHNLDAIADRLEKRGFREVKPGQMSWADQIVAFHEADYVVAAMGSNVSNMIFSKPGARVLVLHPNDSHYSLNVGMAASGGQDVGYLWCECFSNPSRGEHVEIYVDPILLDAGIDALTINQG